MRVFVSVIFSHHRHPAFRFDYSNLDPTEFAWEIFIRFEGLDRSIPNNFYTLLLSGRGKILIKA
jgi:hypothetical protein